jgi:proline iminopeptidase
VKVLCLVVVGFTEAAVAADGSFRRDGVDLYYRTVGSGTPIVFLSGGPGMNAEDLIPASEYVPASFQRVFYEQRGTGRSTVPSLSAANLTVRIAVDDLEALRVHLGQERLLLFGHSWGGLLAMAYAAAYPQRVDRLVLVGPAGPNLDYLEWFVDNVTSRLRPEDHAAVEYWTAAAKRGVDPDKIAVEMIRAKAPSGYFFDRAKGLAVVEKELTDGIMHARVSELLWEDMMKGYDLSPQLQKLDRPVLIVQGHQDPIGQKTAEQIHALIRNSRLVYIPKCGHLPWFEQPDAFRDAISAFLGASR